MKTLKNEVKSHTKNINKHISAQNIIKPPLLAVFISSVIQFDKFVHPVILHVYEKYIICIFMNINENLKMRVNHWVNQYARGYSDLN